MVRAFSKYNLITLPASLIVAIIFTYLMYHVNSQREAYIVDTDKIDIAHGFVLFSLTFGMVYIVLMGIILALKAVGAAFKAVSPRADK